MIQLRDYQERIAKQAAALIDQYRLCYLSMECRTGKTLTALAVAARCKANHVLFITKLKAIPSVKSDYSLLAPGYRLTVVNYESAHKCSGDFDLVILDEAHSLGAYPKPSKRAKSVKALCENLPIIFMSGTPSPESYSQLYHQFWVSTFSPWENYKTFYKWAKEYVTVTPKLINGYHVSDYSKAKKDMIDSDTLHLFIDYSQEDAGFETRIEETILEVPMSTLTARYLETLRKNRILDLGSGHVVLADTPAKLMSKLHQLSSGSVIDEEGNHLIIDKTKAYFIRDIFEGQKIAIFYVYQSEFDLLKSVFPNYTESPEEFQASADKVFISQVRRAREGVRLDTADALIFYNLEYSFLSYEQGRNRLVSKERADAAPVYFLVSNCGIESLILSAVKNKKDFTYSFYKSKCNLYGGLWK